MFDNLSDKLDRAFKVLKGQGQITEINVAETLKEVRRALLDADVEYRTAKEFTDREVGVRAHRKPFFGQRPCGPHPRQGLKPERNPTRGYTGV